MSYFRLLRREHFEQQAYAREPSKSEMKESIETAGILAQQSGCAKDSRII